MGKVLGRARGDLAGLRLPRCEYGSLAVAPRAAICLLISVGVLALQGPASAATTSGAPSADLAATCAPQTTPKATAAAHLDSVFSKQLGPGWIAGDIARSTKLPNGQEAFDFNDTLLGTAQSDGRVSQLTGFIHNSELVGPLSALSTNFGGTSSAPQSLIPDSNKSGGFKHQWEVGSTDVENGKQLIFVNEYKQLSPGVLAFSGRSAIAVFNLPTAGPPKFQALVNDSTVPTNMWGTGMTRDGIYTYIYGTDENHVANGGWMEVARVPHGHTATLSDWQYWNGSAWVNGEANAVVTANSQLFSDVTHQQGGNGYVSVLKAGGGSAPTTIEVSYACAPQGPWSSVTRVYTVPEIAQYGPKEVAYTPNFHPELTTSAGLAISYSVDTTAGLSTLEQNVHQYQPRFLRLRYAPTVTGLAPSGGPTSGGTQVTITGTNLFGASKVLFGSVAATTFKVVSSTRIVATSPAETAASVDVSVVTSGGKSGPSTADVFTYS